MSTREGRTNRFRSEPFRSGLTPIKLRSILAIRSSLKMTISRPKNFTRHGLLAQCALGTLLRRRDVNEEGIGRRGSVEEPHGSSAPGTKRKCEFWHIIGNSAMRSAKASKLSVARTK